MADLKRLSIVLLTTCAAASLAACDGATSVASPGEGGIVLPAPTPAPSPAPTPAPTPTPGTGPAASCPTGTTSVGVIGNFRSCRLPGLIAGTLSLPQAAGVAYEINGRVDVGVDRGASLTTGQVGLLNIAPGAILYANTTNADNDLLVVNRGSTINAEGTETSPIIFTAQNNLTGNVTDESQGLWGGVILAGRAPVSNCIGAGTGGTANCEAVVEGTGNALYGGATANDSSGVMRYVQIRYSGTIISTGNELQGLTTGGVGSGTRLEYIQIHNSSDDGIEIFGGTHNARYLVVTGADDDSIDSDVGWKGFIQFVIAAQRPNNNQADTYMMEIDSNNNEDTIPRHNGRIANFTFIHRSTGVNAAIRLRGGADQTFVNGIVVGQRPCMNIVAGNTDFGGKSTIRPANASIDEAGPPVFNSIYFACTEGLTAETPQNSVTVTNAEQAAIINAGSNNVTNGTATGALVDGFVPGTAAAAVPAFNAATLNTGQPTAFFTTTTYIGAVSGPNDNWYRGWTCNSNRGDFGTTSQSCTTLPGL